MLTRKSFNSYKEKWTISWKIIDYKNFNKKINKRKSDKMNYDIRNISVYFREIHSRYYIDTNGVVYTSLSPKTTRIMINNIRTNINDFKIKNYNNLDKNINMIIQYKNTDYFLLYDGTMLKRLKTTLTEKGEVCVSIIRVINGNGTGNKYFVHRLVAGCFLGKIENKEVHHIDKNRKNNHVSNLQILTFNEHRGKENYIKNHF